MSVNNFNGTFPGDWIENLAHLKSLSFFKNSFAGALPSSLSSLKKFGKYLQQFHGITLIAWQCTKLLFYLVFVQSPHLNCSGSV
jgi:hypothetical protein